MPAGVKNISRSDDVRVCTALRINLSPMPMPAFGEHSQQKALYSGIIYGQICGPM